MQASTGEPPLQNSESIESDQDIHQVPDVELLTFQKQRSTPKVKLSEVNLDGEIDHLEIEDFAQVSGPTHHMGLAAAGTEEQVIRQLHKAGSLDASEILPDLTADAQ